MVGTAVTKGNWNGVLDAFDAGEGAKAASLAVRAIEEEPGGLLGVAAE